MSNASDVAEAMLGALHAQLDAALEAIRARGGTYEMRAPSVVVVSTKHVTEGLEVTWYGHFRIGHYAQSGSDWNEHEVVVKTTTFGEDGTIVSDHLVARGGQNVSEYDEDDYEDDREAQALASAMMKR